MTTRRRRIAKIGLVVLLVYAGVGYLALPLFWRHYENQPALATVPMVTRTGSGIPGDPLNIGLVGDKEDVVLALHAAGFTPADPITLKTSAEIVGSVLLDRPYRAAPVSPLFYEGRREDLAFEMEAGASARQRHHVRLWEVLPSGVEKRPVWLGAASFDEGVGVSHYTGQVTHSIAPDVDAERDFLAARLQGAEMVDTTYQITGVGPTLNGRNGEGSRYYTDGEIHFLVLVSGGRPRTGPPDELSPSAVVIAKNALWQALKPLLSGFPGAAVTKP